MTTCQICGRIIKAKNGLIAHHGYQRPGQGWQTASCFGARYRPYEVACDAIPLAIKHIERFIDLQESILANLIANPPDKITDQIVKRESLRPADFDPKKLLESDQYRPGSYANLFKRRVESYRQAIKIAKHDRVMLEKRLADWRPRNQK